MRDLHSWLNKRVLVVGTVAKFTENAIMFTDVSVRLYGDNEQNAKFIDHLWVYKRKDLIINNSGLGTKQCVIGDVVKYVRRNGTSDYGIEPSAELYNLADVINKNEKMIKKDPERAKSLFLFLLDCLKKRNLFYHPGMTYKDVQDYLFFGLERLNNRIENKQLTKKKISESMKHKKGNITKDPVSFKSKKNNQKCGFGFSD